MIVAALYDVHGNLPALRAVLADGAFARADAVVVGGDVVAGPMPAEVLDALASLALPVRWVRGNADRLVLDHLDRGDLDPAAHDDPAGRADAFAAARLRAPEHRALLAGFEPTIALDGARFCHGSPRDDDEILTPLSPPERVADALAGVAEELVVCGHTHRQFDRRVAGHRLVNAGSVGMPYEGRPGAFWLLVAGGEPELRRTEYDVEAAAAALRSTGFPDADSMLEPVDPDEVTRFFEGRAGT